MTLSDLGPFYAYWAEWFAQPMAEKMKHLRDRSASTGWYFPPGTEAPGYGEADSKEYVHLKWGMPELHEDVFYAGWRTSQIWLRERGLTELAEAIRVHDCVLRILHYPPQPEGAVGAAHVDFDLLTVSLPGTAPGLEVHAGTKQGPSGGWFDSWVPQPEQVDVHVGEMLEIYCGAGGANDSTDWARIGPGLRRQPYAATLHRVRAPANTDRLKAVFFVLPPNEFVLRPGGGVDDFGPGSYGFRPFQSQAEAWPPFTAGDYLRGVLNKASPGAGVQR